MTRAVRWTISLCAVRSKFRSVRTVYLHLSLKVFMHHFCVTIGAFNPAVLIGYLQPNAWVPQSAFTTITGHAIGLYNFCLRCLSCHFFAFWLLLGLAAHMSLAKIPKHAQPTSTLKGRLCHK